QKFVFRNSFERLIGRCITLNGTALDFVENVKMPDGDNHFIAQGTFGIVIKVIRRSFAFNQIGELYPKSGRNQQKIEYNRGKGKPWNGISDQNPEVEKYAQEKIRQPESFKPKGKNEHGLKNDDQVTQKLNQVFLIQNPGRVAPDNHRQAR